MAAARARSIDVVLIDTAGRLHTKVNLMEELKKVKRVISKQLSDAPHEVLLVLDATTGQNAISQTRLFHDELAVSGLALTKLDGTAKGGIVVGICQEFQIPIRFIGLGEGLDDLKEFDAEQFAAALF
jgi:fused signal recognition particle receptor